MKLIVEVADKCIKIDGAKVTICSQLRYYPQSYCCHLLDDKLQGQVINKDCECARKRFDVLEE